MATPGIHAPSPGGGVCLATTGRSAWPRARVPDVVATFVMATKLRRKVLPQADVSGRRFFIQTILTPNHGLRCIAYFGP